ncbi:MAG: arsinothricin resistance N-acetyltransferase ArsN1 family B [Solirubrobacterales bacterium]
MIEDVGLEDAERVCRIYNHYVERTTITFEEEPVSVEQMRTRMAEIGSCGLPWIVWREGPDVLGYAYAGRWKSRSAYRRSVESSVYVGKDHVGRGIGSSLYEELLSRLRQASVHVVVGGVALPNEASVRLHEQFGFRKVAHFQQIGFKLGRWIDVGYWQLLL